MHLSWRHHDTETLMRKLGIDNASALILGHPSIEQIVKRLLTHRIGNRANRDRLVCGDFVFKVADTRTHEPDDLPRCARNVEEPVSRRKVE